MNKQKILLVLFAGVLFGGAFAMSAFTEPSSPPGSTTSYVPINVGPLEQVRVGKLCIGDGTDQAPSDCADYNSFYVEGVLGTEGLDVRQNATLVGNVDVKDDAVIAGALRIPQLFIPSDIRSVDQLSGQGIGGIYTYSSVDVENATQTTPSIYFNYITTNLGMGKTCTTAANAACPIGWILSKYNSSTTVSTCREINPHYSPNQTPQNC